ncbi:undecaprenyl-diphosphatase [Bacillus carboniphilus]|uniref:undecaprenyl-diphosphatase n=1 Tax=Bacillus carboniphilus TaxID=86663 RepID=UPI0031D4AF74
MDDKIFRAITLFSGRISIVDKLMILISNRARYVYLIILLCLWFKNRASKQASKQALVAGVIGYVLNILIKCFYFKPRPFVKKRVGILIPSKKDSTFPSKHTLLSFAVSTTLFLYNRTIGSLMIGLSTLTGFSRIWVGHHYPSDIIFSAVLGSMTGIFVRYYDYLQKRMAWLK